MSRLSSLLSTPRRIHFAAFLFYLLIALLITWPLVTVLSTHFAGYAFGDAHEMTRHIWWFKYAAQHGEPLLFQPLLGYPDGMEGVILWSDPLQFFPGWLLAFFLPLPAAYNLQSLLNLALNGWAAWFLVWKLTHQRLPALLAGVVFMAAPTLQGHLASGHGGLLVQWPLPLFAYALLALRAATRPAYNTSPPASASADDPASITTLSPQSLVLSPVLFPSLLITFFFVLLPFGHTLQLIYAGLPLLAVFGLTLLVERNWRGLLRLVIAIGAGAVILLVFLIPVLSATFGTSAYTAEGGGVAYSIDLLAIVTPSFNHPLYGQMDYTHRVLGINIAEGSSYVGIIAGLLALVAVWELRPARWWLLLAAAAWVLALGPLLKLFDQPVTLRSAEYTTFVTLPWALLADLPGLSLARTPGRFNFLLALAVSVLSGYGLSALLSSRLFRPSLNTASSPGTPRSTPRAFLSPQSLVLSPLLITCLLILLTLLDYQSFWPLPTYSAELPQAVHDLSERQDVRAVFDMPWDNLLAAKDALWLQTAHHKPLIAGQVTRRTPVSPAKLTILEQTLDPALLHEAGADVIILHKTYDYDGALATLTRAKLGEPYYEDERLALWDAPEADNAPEFIGLDVPAANPTEELTLTIADNQVQAYFYVPQAGWVNLTGALFFDETRQVQFALDGNPFHPFILSNQVMLDEWLPIKEAGYHTITISVSPACSQLFPSDGFECRTFRLQAVRAQEFIPQDFPPPVEFDRGVRLVTAFVPGRVGNATLPLTLGWEFDEPVTDQDIRFIKVLDMNGNAVATSDIPLGTYPPGSQWLETIAFSIPESPGTYRVYVGWYTYPDLTRFPVLSDVPGAPDGWAMIGEFTIP